MTEPLTKDLNEWVKNKTPNQIVTECNNGSWFLLLAAHYNLDVRKIALACGKCANTVSHLMEDERSIKAINAAILFGEGKLNREDLTKIDNDALQVMDSMWEENKHATVAYSPSYYAASAARFASWITQEMPRIVYLYAALAPAYNAALAMYAEHGMLDSFREKGNKETADICREVFGSELEELIKKSNESH